MSENDLPIEIEFVDHDEKHIVGESTPVSPTPSESNKEEPNWKERFLRKAAEFENFRRRVIRDRKRERMEATASLMVDLIPVLDHFEQALGQKLDESTQKGLLSMRRALLREMERHGLVTIQPQIGVPFDPKESEAVQVIPSSEYPEGVVLEVLQRGYRMGERLLRPARVRVSTGA